MEEEELTSSHHSPADDDAAAAVVEDDDDQESGSPRSSSPQPNGRITVTVASPAPPVRSSPPPSSQQSLALTLQIQNRRSTPSSSAATTNGGGGSGGGREDCWSEDATAVLIEAWRERYVELSRGNLKQKHWDEVAEIVSARAGGGKPAKTDVQCKNRIDTVKKKYKSEKAKIAAGGGPSKWPFFDRLDRLLGSRNSSTASAKISPAAVVVTPSTSHDAGHKVPVGIPVGRSIHHRQPPSSKQQMSPILQQNHKFLRQNNSGSRQRMKRPVPPPVDSDSEADDLSPDSSGSMPPGLRDDQRSSKRQRSQFNCASLRPPRFDGSGRTVAGAGAAAGCEDHGKANGWENSVRELTRAILKFGEAYEQAESAKLQQTVEMEKQRMKFAKELELQRMKFLMKTQLELSQLSCDSGRLRGVIGAGGGGGGRGDGDHQGHHHQINGENNVNNSDVSN